MSAVRFVFRLVIGLAFGILTMAALSPVFAAFMRSPDQPAGDDPTTGIAWLVALLVAALCAFAPTIRRAFGRGFLCLGAAVFALPLSMMTLSGRLVSETTDAGDAAAAVIAGGIVSGAAGVVGFFLGSILLLAGLILALGGRREVIIHLPPQPR